MSSATQNKRFQISKHDKGIQVCDTATGASIFPSCGEDLALLSAYARNKFNGCEQQLLKDVIEGHKPVARMAEDIANRKMYRRLVS